MFSTHTYVHCQLVHLAFFANENYHRPIPPHKIRLFIRTGFSNFLSRLLVPNKSENRMYYCVFIEILLEFSLLCIIKEEAM